MARTPPNLSDDDTTELPPADNKRWNVQQKAAVLGAVHRSFLTLDEACARYSLSIDEFRGWERAMARYGLQGLRATRHQTCCEIVRKRRAPGSRLTSAAQERARRLRQTIARFERLLEEGTSPKLAAIYRAEIAAAEAMLAKMLHQPQRQ